MNSGGQIEREREVDHDPRVDRVEDPASLTSGLICSNMAPCSLVSTKARPSAVNRFRRLCLESISRDRDLHCFLPSRYMTLWIFKPAPAGLIKHFSVHSNGLRLSILLVFLLVSLEHQPHGGLVSTGPLDIRYPGTSPGGAKPGLRASPLWRGTPPTATPRSRHSTASSFGTRSIAPRFAKGLLATPLCRLPFRFVKSSPSLPNLQMKTALLVFSFGGDGGRRPEGGSSNKVLFWGGARSVCSSFPRCHGAVSFALLLRFTERVPGSAKQGAATEPCPEIALESTWACPSERAEHSCPNYSGLLLVWSRQPFLSTPTKELERSVLPFQPDGLKRTPMTQKDPKGVSFLFNLDSKGDLSLRRTLQGYPAQVFCSGTTTLR